MPKIPEYKLFNQGVLSITYISPVDVSRMSFDIETMHTWTPQRKSILIDAFRLVSDTTNRKRGWMNIRVGFTELPLNRVTDIVVHFPELLLVEGLSWELSQTTYVI